MKKRILIYASLFLLGTCFGFGGARAFSTTPGQVAIFDGTGGPTDSIARQDGELITITGSGDDGGLTVLNSAANGYSQLRCTNDVGHSLMLWQAGSSQGFHSGQGLMYTNQLHIFTDANIPGGDGSINLYTNVPGYWVDSPRFQFTGDGAFKLNDVNTARIILRGSQVVGSRRTGWTAPTGIADRSTFNTATVTTEELARRLKALEDDLTAHGLIGN